MAKIIRSIELIEGDKIELIETGKTYKVRRFDTLLNETTEKRHKDQITALTSRAWKHFVAMKELEI